jgi:hypothetical protein
LDCDYCGLRKKVFTVVENQKPTLGPEDSWKPLRQICIRSFLDADRPGHRCPHQGRIRYLAQVHEIDPVREPWRYRRRIFDCQTGLTDTSGSDEGH